MVCHRLHAIREAIGMRVHQSCFISPSEEAIIRVDVEVACIFQARAHHSVCLTLDQCLVDVHVISVPAAPAHQWGQEVCSFAVGRLLLRCSFVLASGESAGSCC